jgi:uncharacterized membrane-anchored protein YhcB (DUF1043 family)
VYELDSPLIAALIALIVGAVLGALLTRRLSSNGRKQRELERNVDRLLQQQKDYQHQVVEHFTDTAKLLNNLADSYRDVHNHLAKGASTLCDDETGDILPPIQESPIAQITGGDTGEQESSPVQPPLDYAPKPSPNTPGVLNEEFGLDKRPGPVDEAATAVDERPVEAPLEEAEVVSR